ncbi:MAG: threonine/serine exporter family protein, partial [Gemmatimonadales bacterium]
MSPQAIEFVLRMGRAFHRHGFSAARVEEVMVRLAERLGLPLAQIFSTPTSIMAAFGPLGTQSSHLLRVEPGSMNLAQVSQLDRLAIDVVQGDVAPLGGIARLREIEDHPKVYGALASIGAFVTATGTVSVFLGGGRKEL